MFLGPTNVAACTYLSYEETRNHCKVHWVADPSSVQFGHGSQADTCHAFSLQVFWGSISGLGILCSILFPDLFSTIGRPQRTQNQALGFFPVLLFGMVYGLLWAARRAMRSDSICLKYEHTRLPLVFNFHKL